MPALVPDQAHTLTLAENPGKAAMHLRRVCFFALLVLFNYVAMAGAMPGRGDVPPSYLGRDAQDHDVHVEDMHGKVVVITFWASWCGYCLKELPTLASIQKLAGADKLQVVAISYKEDYGNFVKIRHNLRKYNLVLTYDSNSAISAAYGVTGIPHMVMIGRDGRIAHVHVGYDESMLDTIANELNELLAAPVPANTQAP
jgi:thiol-disulfide isomerase/thioredoxin